MLTAQANSAFQDNPDELNRYLVAQLELIDEAERKNRTSGMTRKEENERDSATLPNTIENEQNPFGIENYLVTPDLRDFNELLDNNWSTFGQGVQAGSVVAGIDLEETGGLNTPTRPDEIESFGFEN